MPPALRCLCLIGAALLASGFEAVGQTPDTFTLAGRLHAEALRGDVRSLRDLATLTDRPGGDSGPRQILVDLIAVSPGGIDPATAPRQELLDFYYARADSLRYSPLLQVFYDVPLERHGTSYDLVALDAYLQSDRSMHLRTYLGYVEEAVELGSVEDLESLAEKIADLQLPEGQTYLLGWLGGSEGELLAREPAAFRHYVRQLLDAPDERVAAALFDSERRGYIEPPTLAGYLSRLANTHFPARWPTERQRERFERLVDSLGGLARLREYGYSVSVPFAPQHFREPVDFYGRVLAEPGLPAYVAHNALLDLVDSHHPRALFYIAAQLWRARNGTAALPSAHYLYLLRKLTGLGVRVPNAAGAKVYELDIGGDRTAWLNFVRYWAGRYEDYDYDEHRRGFVNRHDRSLETENLERLFRLLNSESDAVALKAYGRLTRADPVEVAHLAAKYKGLLRSTNPTVPPLRDGHLEQLSELTAYCRRNRVAFTPTPRLAGVYDTLLLDLGARYRVDLENRLIGELTLADLTALEYWGALHQYDVEAGFSVGRILDYAYTRHWHEVVDEDAQLRLYLKKASVFARMDGIGVTDDYLRKFGELDAGTEDRLAELLRSEGDDHVRRSLRRLLREEGEPGVGSDDDVATLDAFLAAPEQLTREEVALLPHPTLEQLSELLWLLEDSPTPKAKIRLRAYLDSRLDDTRIVPDLMSLLMRGESRDEVAKLLSRVYHFSFEPADGEQADQWLQRWREHSTTYPTWAEEFYRIHVARLADDGQVTAADLNAILRSPHYRERERATVLDALPRLASNRHLFALRFEPPLEWSERVVLSGLDLTYKDLQDLDKLFPDVPPAELVDYIITEAQAFDYEERGSLFNALLRKPYIGQLLDRRDFASHAAEIQESLRTYLEDSPLLSAYEEEMTALNLARLQSIGASPAERLRLSLDLEVDAAAKLRIQEGILARLSYTELPAALKLYSRLAEANGQGPYNFLNRDFGLPIFDLASARAIDTFAARHARLTQCELYATYLAEFGLAVREATGALDYDAVARILAYDIALPFIGGGGNRRDLYVYGVIKLLELTHDTTLGFHEKLNENQVFYSYSATKRAEAWLVHLRTSGLIEREDLPARPSFTASMPK